MPLVKNLSPRDHATPTLCELHWLPIQVCINFKICLLMYQVYTNSSPFYVSSLVTPCSSLQSRQALRFSPEADFVVTWSLRKFGNRAFALAGPTEWKRGLNFIRKSASLSLFKTYFKTYCLTFLRSCAGLFLWRYAPVRCTGIFFKDKKIFVCILLMNKLFSG